MKTYALFNTEKCSFVSRKCYITDTLEEAIQAAKDDKAADEYVYMFGSKELYVLASITVDGEILYPADIYDGFRLAEIIKRKRKEEIVRCKDCARFIPEGTLKFDNGETNKDTCDVIRGFVVQIDPNGYCAWGKRKVGDV